MADMDGFKEAEAFGFGKPQENTAFFLKGRFHTNFTQKIQSG